MKKKMVLIGCGSAMFTKGLVMDLIKHPAGFQWELALCDIDRVVLESMEKLVKKMITAKGADIKIAVSDDRKELLPGADYVVCTISVGKRVAREQDVFIPRKYGIYQPVGDTVMPGGFSRAMRMVPAMLDIVKDCLRFCPNARFINYANPMAIICRAIMKTTSYPVTGLCTGTPDSMWYMADTAGIPRNEATARAVGLNHLTFIYKLMHNGEDAKPKLLDVLKQQYDLSAIDKTATDPVIAGRSGKTPGEPFAWSFFLKYGAFPAPGDRHITEFFAERFPGGKYYGKTLGVDAYSFEGSIAGGDRIHNETMVIANDPAPLTEDFFSNIGGEHEQLMEIIDSYEHDYCRIYFANLPNRGAVPNLPYDSVLEMPCIATAQGMRPMQTLDFPDHLAAIIQKNLAIIEVAVDAAVKGDVRLFEEAILMGGYITDAAVVKSMVAELIQAQKKYLPQF